MLPRGNYWIAPAHFNELYRGQAKAAGKYFIHRIGSAGNGKLPGLAGKLVYVKLLFIYAGVGYELIVIHHCAQHVKVHKLARAGIVENQYALKPFRKNAVGKHFHRGNVRALSTADCKQLIGKNKHVPAFHIIPLLIIIPQRHGRSGEQGMIVVYIAGKQRFTAAGGHAHAAYYHAAANAHGRIPREINIRHGVEYKRINIGNVKRYAVAWNGGKVARAYAAGHGIEQVAWSFWQKIGAYGIAHGVSGDGALG